MAPKLEAVFVSYLIPMLDESAQRMTLGNHLAKIRIGTRGSRLARVQADMVQHALLAACPFLAEGGRIEIVPITTSGDMNKDVPLYEIGGKGLFVKEIEEALLNGSIDIAVHSLKDVPGFLPHGLIIGAVLEREDPRDVLIAPHADSFQSLPRNARFGTSSPRRAAQASMHRPDLAIQPLRGNVPTRIEKIEQGEADATLLALAGLKRLGMDNGNYAVLSIEDMLPAIAQGTIGLECREDNLPLREALHLITHAKTEIETAAERALLATLDGSCRSPIAGFAQLRDGNIHLRGLVASMDGKECYRSEMQGLAADAEKVGADMGKKLLALGGDKLVRL